ncbi:hypothetical protein CsSME_00011211 [Camellia sinensis var. sinensis]
MELMIFKLQEKLRSLGGLGSLECDTRKCGTWFWCCGYHIPTVVVKMSVFLFHELAAAAAIKMDW